MKKIILLVLSAALLLSLVACGSAKKVEREDPSTPAGALMNAFLDEVEKDDKATCEDIARTLSENEAFVFMPMVMPVEEGYLAGFTEDITGFKDGAVFCPMISTIPFVGYVFELSDEAAAESFAKDLTSKADLNWNICTCADEMKSKVYGNKVCFIMSAKSFDEE